MTMQIYWVGPLLGSLLASGFYKLIKAMEYETANPGQDFDENETKLFDPERDVDRPIVNLVAPESTSDHAGQSRPISGDTLGGFRREEIPLEPIKTSQSGKKSLTPPMKGGRRGSSPLTPATAVTGSSTAAGTTSGVGEGEDIVHGGAHYTQTANQLDPRVQGGLAAPQAYQDRPDAEAGRQSPRSSGYAWVHIKAGKGGRRFNWMGLNERLGKRCE